METTISKIRYNQATSFSYLFYLLIWFSALEAVFLERYFNWGKWPIPWCEVPVKFPFKYEISVVYISSICLVNVKLLPKTFKKFIAVSTAQ